MKMAKVLKKLIEDSGYNISQFSKKMWSSSKYY